MRVEQRPDVARQLSVGAAGVPQKCLPLAAGRSSADTSSLSTWFQRSGSMSGPAGQAVASALAFHVVVRQAAELVVHDRGQLGERALVHVAPRTQKRTEVAQSRFSSAPATIHGAGHRIMCGLHHFFE